MARLGVEDEWDSVSTIRKLERDDASLSLQVIGESFVATHPLPASGELLIGRSEKADVPLDDPSISRQHARLYLGPVLQLEDLGSENGTRVSGRVLEPKRRTRISPGEVIDFGGVLAVIHRGATMSRPRRLWAHGYFEARVDEECDKSERTRGTFAVARLGVDDYSALPAVHQALAELMPKGDLVATYGPMDLELLLLNVTADQATQRVDGIVTVLATQRRRVRAGVACYPRDGATAAALIARACTNLRGVAPAADAGEPVIADPAMKALYRLVDRVAPSALSVLVLGETGAGKELLARRLHQRSTRAKGPLVALSCAALPEQLLESELFGHERGAFTGAQQAKPGLLESANGGTVFLDEIGELPVAMQAKLLRALESHEVLRVGAVRPTPLDVRFVSATNRDLGAEVDAGGFRKDLFFRLNGVTLTVPPLRERKEDIVPLAESFLVQAMEAQGRKTPLRLGPEARTWLCEHAWPGNVRELRNVIERAVLLCAGELITAEHLPGEKLSSPSSPGPHNAAAEVALPPELEAERQRIVGALARSAGNQTRAAKELGLSRGTLLIKMDAYRIARPRKKLPFG